MIITASDIADLRNSIRKKIMTANEIRMSISDVTHTYRIVSDGNGNSIEHLFCLRTRNYVPNVKPTQRIIKEFSYYCVIFDGKIAETCHTFERALEAWQHKFG